MMMLKFGIGAFLLANVFALQNDELSQDEKSIVVKDKTREEVRKFFNFTLYGQRNREFEIISMLRNDFMDKEILGKLLNLSAAENQFRGFDIYSMINLQLSKPKVRIPWISEMCSTSLWNLVTSSNKMNLLKMLDSWGKIPSRVLSGNFLWIGAYDECTKLSFAKHCGTQINAAKLTHSEKIPLVYGSCWPVQCTNKDVENVMTYFLGFTKGLMKHTVSVCDEKNVTFDAGAVATLFIMSLLLLLCVFGTILDISQEEEKIKPESDTDTSSKGVDNKSFELTEIQSNSEPDLKSNGSVDTLQNSETSIKQPATLKNTQTTVNKKISFFLCFSLKKNSKAMFATNVPKGAITCINGMRVISLSWILIGHFYDVIIYSLPDNATTVLDMARRFTFLGISGAYLAVDTFFLLSGLLISYLTLKKTAKRGLGGGDVIMMYVHRIIRLTPTLGIAMLFWTNVFPLMLNGPLKAIISKTQHIWDQCIDYWWTTLIYINNFYPNSFDKGCMKWTWYLANDTQFYILAPAILILMLQIQKFSPTVKKAVFNNFVALLLMCILSMITLGAITGYYDIPGLLGDWVVPNNPRAQQADMVMDYIYTKPYNRIAPYIIGMFLGYLFHKDISLDTKNGALISRLGWCIAIILALLVVYGPWRIFKENGSFFNDAENIMYSACHRFLWSCSVAWVIYACHNNHGGIINDFLSWKIWMPFSRLTYCAYLVHLMVMLYFTISHEVAWHYQDSFMAINIIAVTVFSYACAFILSVSIEYPIQNLEKIIFGR